MWGVSLVATGDPCGHRWVSLAAGLGDFCCPVRAIDEGPAVAPAPRPRAPGRSHAAVRCPPRLHPSFVPFRTRSRRGLHSRRIHAARPDGRALVGVLYAGVSFSSIRLRRITLQILQMQQVVQVNNFNVLAE